LGRIVKRLRSKLDKRIHHNKARKATYMSEKKSNMMHMSCLHEHR
jgi:hypothetical protein